MDVILLENVYKLGTMGDVVSVKPGFARNYLLPQGKALRSNKANRAVFEQQRAELEVKNDQRKKDAEATLEKLDNKSFVMIRQSGETGQLYGSVSTRDVAKMLDEQGFPVSPSNVQLQSAIKMIGIHELTIRLHANVESQIKVNVARTEEEAEMQERGESVMIKEEDDFAANFEFFVDPDDMDDEPRRKKKDKKEDKAEGEEGSEAKSEDGAEAAAESSETKED